METFKLVISFLLSPLLICLILQSLGWLLYWRRQPRYGLILIALGGVVLWVGSLSGLTFEKRRASEWTYLPLNIHESVEVGQPTVIVVLGTGYNSDPMLPANSQVSGGFHARLLEGVRVYHALPDSQLLISVAGTADSAKKTEFLNSMIRLLQLDPQRVKAILDAESTFDEADHVALNHHGEQIVLVTSAGHMPRAFEVFCDKDLAVTAAPADFFFTRSGSPDEKIWPRWAPSTDGINGNRQWLYEQVAGIWHRVSGG